MTFGHGPGSEFHVQMLLLQLKSFSSEFTVKGKLWASCFFLLLLRVVQFASKLWGPKPAPQSLLSKVNSEQSLFSFVPKPRSLPSKVNSEQPFFSFALNSTFQSLPSKVKNEQPFFSFAPNFTLQSSPSKVNSEQPFFLLFRMLLFRVYRQR